MYNFTCVLKISDNAVPFLTHLNPETGKIVQDYPFIESVYDVLGINSLGSVPRNLPDIDRFYDLILSIKNARMAIYFDVDKFLVITDTSTVIYDDQGSAMDCEYIVQKPLVKVQVSEVGMALTHCYTLNVIQPASRLALFKWDQLYIMTEDGAISVPDNVVLADLSVRITPAMILDSGQDAYGAYAVDDKIYYITKER